MIDIDQEDSYLDQAIQEYYDKKYKKKYSIPDKIETFSVNDLW